jgi:hypothetical protein
VGAQGGQVEALSPAFTGQPAAALVTASRSIVEPAVDARNPLVALGFASKLRDEVWAVSEKAQFG